MKTLKDFKFKDKKVILRTNFDVPLDKKGKIVDDFRIRKSLPSIEFLIESGAKIILISHLGRPQKMLGEKGKKKNLSLSLIAKRLSDLLGKEVKFVNDSKGKKVERMIKKMKPGEIVLLENLRFYLEEFSNDNLFAKELASLADIYINDAFGICHRKHASVVGIPKYLPYGAGFLLEEEIKTLSSVTAKSERSIVFVLGGAKIGTKIPCLMNFLKIADHLLLGGMIGPVILAVKKISISGFSLGQGVEKDLAELELTNPKLHLPIDAMVGLKNHQENYLRQTAVGKIRNEEQMFDIGPETIRIFSDILEEAKTVIWNGPLGYIEDERFANGTLAIASAILRTSAFSVVGGGETNAFLAANNLRDKFSYISTGGGAMLEFLSGKKLPGIEVLKQ